MKVVYVFKDSVFCPNYDNCGRLPKELNMEDNHTNDYPTFVRVELIPPHNSLKFPVESWRLEVDQNVFPKWWNPTIYKPLIQEAVEKWYRKYVIFGGEHHLTGGSYYVFDNAHITGNKCTIHAFDNSDIAVSESQVLAYDQASIITDYDCCVIAYDSSKAIIQNNSHAIAYNRAKIITKDIASAVLRHKSTGESYGRSSIEVFNDSKVVCHDSSICFGYQGKSIQCYNESVAHVYNTESIEGHDNSVLFIHNNIEPTFLTILDNALVRNIKK